MNKLKLNIECLQVQTFETAAAESGRLGTVRGFAEPKKTGINDTNCSAIDACASARGCTVVFETCYGGCEETYTCESYNDACPTGRGCSDLFPC